MKDGEILEDSEQSSQAGAINRASELAKTKGKVEVWVPAFVVVPETKFNVIDYGKSKEL
jgi:hypothetical protein